MTDTDSSERTPEFSLIVTTKDRTRELADLLQSLDRQRFRSFELIVSDQNADDRLLPVLAPFRQQFPLRHIRSAGARRADVTPVCHSQPGAMWAFPTMTAGSRPIFWRS